MNDPIENVGHLIRNVWEERIRTARSDAYAKGYRAGVTDALVIAHDELSEDEPSLGNIIRKLLGKVMK